MKKKRNPIVIIILVLMIIILLGGIIVLVIDNMDVDKKSKEKVIKKTDQHTKLFTASNDNWGETDISEDYWSSSYWTVYYDGTVEYYEVYNLSGETSHVTWELSHEDYEKLCRNLQGRFLKCDQGVDACDGEGWSMTYYGTDGEKIHNFFGYMYGIPVLEEIVEILASDKTSLVVISDITEEDIERIEPGLTGTMKETYFYAGDYKIDVVTLLAGCPGQNGVEHSSGFNWIDEDYNVTYVNLDYVYEEKSLSDYYNNTEHLKTTTVGDKDFLYEMLPDGQLWMYYPIDDEICIVLKLGVLCSYNAYDEDYDEVQIDLEDVLEDDIIEEAIRFEVSKR